MEKLKKAKILGTIGSPLVLLSIFVSVDLSSFILLYTTGIILVIIALKEISDYSGDKTILKNALAATIISFASLVFIVVSLTYAYVKAFTYLKLPTPLNDEEFAKLSWEAIKKYPEPFIVILLISWLLTIVWAMLLKKSLFRVAEVVQINTFKQTAQFYWIGSLLAIVIVGLLIAFIGSILQIIAFAEIESPNKNTDETKQLSIN